jgi:hypothetical protein
MLVRQSLPGVLAALLLGLAAGACSLIVESDETQCHTDADCARFPGTWCDIHQAVCFAADASADGASCEGGPDGGC